jgi:SAM-dependent methyltransferase
MPHKTPDFTQRTHPGELTELMDDPCSREQLRACLRDLSRVNRWTLAYRPLIAWLASVAVRPMAGSLRILDVGCGYGDGLRRIECWARERGVSVELTGIDLNPDSTVIAREAAPADSRIRWVSGDVFAYQPRRPPHLVISSLFTHHLEDHNIVGFIRWMEVNAEFGWFVNDLSRAAIPYHFFRIFSKFARLHPFVQHDGPVSIARSFAEEDWRKYCSEAGLGDSNISLISYKPARLCVSRVKRP